MTRYCRLDTPGTMALPGTGSAARPQGMSVPAGRADFLATRQDGKLNATITTPCVKLNRKIYNPPQYYWLAEGVNKLNIDASCQARTITFSFISLVGVGPPEGLFLPNITGMRLEVDHPGDIVFMDSQGHTSESLASYLAALTVKQWCSSFAKNLNRLLFCGHITL